MSGLRDAIEACERATRDESLRAALSAVSAPALHDDACCAKGCTLMHSTLLEVTRQLMAECALPSDVMPSLECDGSCNCVAAPFIAAVKGLMSE